MMVAFIDTHRDCYGVEPICAVLPIAPSHYYQQKARQSNPAHLPHRTRRDCFLQREIQRVWDENKQVYGAYKVWRQLNREGIGVARCTVERLMRRNGLKGVVRGKKHFTTKPDSIAAEKLPDLVQRNFSATCPDQLWLADFTYVATWRGVVYVAFVIDVYSRRIVGWRVSSSMKTGLVLDALEQAMYFREAQGVIHHSDRGSQYLSIKYTERLLENGMKPSVGTTGDSYDNALAETIIGLFKTEIIYQKAPWRNLEMVEFETLEWVDWFNHKRILGPIGDMPPAEFENEYYAKTNGQIQREKEKTLK